MKSIHICYAPRCVPGSVLGEVEGWEGRGSEEVRSGRVVGKLVSTREFTISAFRLPETGGNQENWVVWACHWD